MNRPYFFILVVGFFSVGIHAADAGVSEYIDPVAEVIEVQDHQGSSEQGASLEQPEAETPQVQADGRDIQGSTVPVEQSNTPENVEVLPKMPQNNPPVAEEEAKEIMPDIDGAQALEVVAVAQEEIKKNEVLLTEEEYTRQIKEAREFVANNIDKKADMNWFIRLAALLKKDDWTALCVRYGLTYGLPLGAAYITYKLARYVFDMVASYLKEEAEMLIEEYEEQKAEEIREAIQAGIAMNQFKK